MSGKRIVGFAVLTKLYLLPMISNYVELVLLSAGLNPPYELKNISKLHLTTQINTI